jgi:hypothetical protein
MSVVVQWCNYTYMSCVASHVTEFIDFLFWNVCIPWGAYCRNTTLSWPCEMSHILKGCKIWNTRHWGYGKLFDFLYTVIIFVICVITFLCCENDIKSHTLVLCHFIEAERSEEPYHQCPVVLQSVVCVIVFPASCASLCSACLVTICPCQKSLPTMFLDLNCRLNLYGLHHYHFITDQALWPIHSPDFIFFLASEGQIYCKYIN